MENGYQSKNESIQTQQELDKFFMCLAYSTAMMHSDDPDTKSGCVIVLPDGRAINGTNRLPVGIRKTHERVTKPLKYEYLEHCERDAIHRAQQDVSGSTLYVNWKPCMQCACAMINAGIKRVVILELPLPKGRGFFLQ